MARIVFFGNERLATGVTTDTPTLRALLAAGHEVVAVVSHHTESRSRKERQLEITAVAEEHNIPLLLPEKPALIANELRALKADIGVLVAYGKIVPQSVIDIFPYGIINIHPSLLPLHRGPIPLESVILEGASETGVSVMQLVKAMDAGPIYAQRQLPLRGDESKQELADTLLRIGGEMVVKQIPLILVGKATPTPQDDTQATYDALITKQDGILDFTEPAERLEREIRAYSGWPGSKTVIAGREVIVTEAFTAGYELHGKDVQVGDFFAAPDGSIGAVAEVGTLLITRLKPAGKQEMTAQAFLNGYGKDL